ncbi:MAG: hypothetical protein BWK76_00810 [Desulfobulbaceae bacterium A2]|nr:MAG: hypothetical protein BWK76_00810 [Desulfobulbaceae bacterium A2]
MNSIQPHVSLGLLLAAAALLMLLSGWVLWLRLSVAGQRQRLRDLEQKLARAREKINQLTDEREERQHFHSTLNQAELVTRLQQTRSTGEDRATPAQAPERYRYLEKMVASGMNASEIAGVLPISEAEAHQLVTLMGMSRGDEQKTLSNRAKQPKKRKQDLRESVTGVPAAGHPVRES